MVCNSTLAGSLSHAAAWALAGFETPYHHLDPEPWPLVSNGRVCLSAGLPPGALTRTVEFTHSQGLRSPGGQDHISTGLRAVQSMDTIIWLGSSKGQGKNEECCLPQPQELVGTVLGPCSSQGPETHQGRPQPPKPP